MELTNLKIISAGAGSGKTYRLTQEMVELLRGGEVRAEGIIATTFTRKAAAELQERVRVKLLAEGLTDQADALTNALIGTVHGLGVKLLRRFAFEAGVSPQVDILPEEDQQRMFNQALSAVLDLDLIEEMDRLGDRLGLSKRDSRYDWRKQVHGLVDVARANDFSIQDLLHSRDQSWQSFTEFLPAPDGRAEKDAIDDLSRRLDALIAELRAGDDSTKKTQDVIGELLQARREIGLRGELAWHQWVKLAKLEPAVKSRDAMEPFREYCWTHERLPAFQQDIKAFIFNLFDTAIASLREFDEYKKRRGLIDYTDMEVLVCRLLDQEAVRDVLADELDLLMVDEFQDTSPIQLAIFLKLSQLARHSVWVGDPKQSIYGFRGAEPRLMQAIIQAAGGVRPENVQRHSWRSREELVLLCNAIFTRAFPDLPAEQVALEPVRLAAGGTQAAPEPTDLGQALIHWHFEPEDGGKRLPGRPWTENCLARTLADWLKTEPLILPKGGGDYRPARPGDVAILCRSNGECETVAGALHKAGLRAAIARTGLLETAEIRLVLACLKYVLNEEDSLSAAEIMLLAGRRPIEQIIDDRLDFLEREEIGKLRLNETWGSGDAYVDRLNNWRPRLAELSSAEILNLLLEELDLRRIVAGWGKVEQRLSNIDELRRLALQYEVNCNNTHTAASLGGCLLWLGNLAAGGKDYQGASEDPGAVNVLTYHKSKGLEWPVVICYSLENPLRADLWGISIEAESEEVDLNNVLGGRWLRYWVNPYSDQFSRTPLDDRLAAGAAQAARRLQSLAEEARLLYVGLTRARDYLILPTRPRPTGWLNRVCNGGQEDVPTLDPYTHETPWTWGEKWLDKKTDTFLYPRDFTTVTPAAESIAFLPERQGRQDHEPFDVDPRQWAAELGLVGSAGVVVGYVPLPEVEAEEAYILGRLRKAWLLADHPTYAPELRQTMAEALILRFEQEETIEAEHLLSQSDQWQRWLSNHWPGAEVYRAWPVHHPHRGRLFDATLDWVVDSPEGIVLLQNSTYCGADAKRKATELSAFLHRAGQACTAALGRPVIGAFVHFVNLGQVVEVVFEGVGQAVG